MEEKDKLIGKWSVYDATASLKDKDITAIAEELADISKIKNIINNKPSGSPSISIEILTSGEMKMVIFQSMEPNMPASMRISAVIKWNLENNIMITKPLPERLGVKVIINSDNSLTKDEYNKIREKIPGIEEDTLKNLKSNPIWSNENKVIIIYCGKQCFLTRSKEGILMLHNKKI